MNQSSNWYQIWNFYTNLHWLVVFTRGENPTILKRGEIRKKWKSITKLLMVLYLSTNIYFLSFQPVLSFQPIGSSRFLNNFSNRVINIWNLLRFETVNASSIRSFSAGLNNFNFGSYLVGRALVWSSFLPAPLQLHFYPIYVIDFALVCDYANKTFLSLYFFLHEFNIETLRVFTRWCA